MHIGAQLYTVWKHTQTLEDLALTLKKVSDIGYRYIQLSGSCRCESGWLKEQLKQNGLKCVITHTPEDLLTGDIPEVIRWHKDIGCHYVGLGWADFTKEDGSDYQAFLDTYGASIKGIAAGGLQFMYHNHAADFKKLPNGRNVLEQLCEDFTPEELGITADTFWIQAGGGNPAQWLRKLSGRIPCIHLKDYRMRSWMKQDVFNYFAPIGEGNIDFDEVFAAAEESGTQYMLVEQDDSYGEDPFDCLRRSYAFLHAKGFE